MLHPKFTVCSIRKDGAIMSRSQNGNLIQVMEIAQGRRTDFPDAEIRIILDGVGVLHKFSPINDTLNEENKTCTNTSASCLV